MVAQQAGAPVAASGQSARARCSTATSTASRPPATSGRTATGRPPGCSPPTTAAPASSSGPPPSGCVDCAGRGGSMRSRPARLGGARARRPRAATPRRGPRLHGWAGMPGHIRQSWGPGWALVGDAGYFKDPITTHGMTDALRDAELLADRVLDVLGGAPEAVALAAYQDTRERLVGLPVRRDRGGRALRLGLRPCPRAAAHGQLGDERRGRPSPVPPGSRSRAPISPLSSRLTTSTGLVSVGRTGKDGPP